MTPTREEDSNIGKERKKEEEDSRKRRAAHDDYEGLTSAPYESDKKLHYLDYMAMEVPYLFIPFTFIFMAMRNITSAKKTNPDVIKLGQSITSYRPKMLKVYGRDILTQPGFGARATVDEADRLRWHDVITDRAKSGWAKVMAHAATVKLEKIADPKVRAAFAAQREGYGRMNESMMKIRHLLAEKNPTTEPKKK